MAASGRSVVVGVFNERDDAERAIDALKRNGFSDDQIGFAAKDGSDREGTIRSEEETGDAGGAAAAGALTGGVVGGVLGALAAGLIPGIGPIVAGGLLAGVLGGAAAGAAAGGIIGALAGMGVPEEDARYYDEEFRSGRTLVTVKANGRYDEARQILQQHGAYDVENRGSTAGVTETTPRERYDAPGSSVSAGGSPAMRGNVSGRERREADEMELREEQLTARKEQSTAGRAEIEKDVVTERRAVDVPVTREEVVVTRRPADRTPTGDRINDDESVEMELHQEEVVAEKRTVPYEVVGLEKRTVQDTERVEADVQREVARPSGASMDASASQESSGRGWDEAMPSYRQRWQERHGTSGGSWQDYEPGYRYSHEMANDPRFRNRDWNEIESDMQSDYPEWSRRNGYNSDANAWDRVRDHTRESWEEARTRTRGR